MTPFSVFWQYFDCGLGWFIMARVPTGDENRERGREFDNKTQGPWKGLEFDEIVRYMEKILRKMTKKSDEKLDIHCSQRFIH